MKVKYEKYNRNNFCFLFSSCQIKQHVIDKKKFYGEAKMYWMKYSSITTLTDTIIFERGLRRFYEAGKLSEIGKLKSGLKHGRWYFFNDSLESVVAIRYKNDSLLYGINARVNKLYW